MKKKIVVLEDDQDIREMIEFLLDKEDIKICSYGRTADFFKVDHTDATLFLLDVMLPDGSGLEICRSLRNNSKTAKIPIVIMSALLKNTAVSDCLPKDFIEKPFNIEDFMLRISRLLA